MIVATRKGVDAFLKAFPEYQPYDRLDNGCGFYNQDVQGLLLLWIKENYKELLDRTGD